MLRKSIAAVCLVALVCATVSIANAASVQLTLITNPAAVGCDGCSLSGIGSYQLFAEASAGDNTGIAGYGISVQGVSTFLHRAPRVNSSETPDGDIYPAGFTLLRSGNNAVATGTGFLIGAGQDTVTPTPYLIHGFGQTASSVAAELPPANTNTGIIQPTWNGRLLLGEGMFDGTTPDIDLQNVDVFVNVFTNEGGIAKADLMKQICDVTCGTTGNQPLVADVSGMTTALGDVINLTPVDSAPGTPPVTWSALSGPTYTPGFGAPGGAPGLGTATWSWDPNTQAFQFSTLGSTRGTYVWTGTASNSTGSDGFSITVDVKHVPEPATLSLIGLALVGCIGLIRRR